MKQVIAFEPPDSSGLVVLKSSAFRHIALVLRKKEGDSLNIRVPSGALFSAKIIKIEKNSIICKIMELIQDEKDDGVLFILLQWELKGAKMDAVIRQATELGATHIMPILGDYSIPHTKNEKEVLRREKIICSAREQSGSHMQTKIFASQKLKECLDSLGKLINDKKTCKLIAYEKHGSNSFFDVINGVEDAIVFAVGAEGGISRAECCMLEENGFSTVQFNTNILRAETASVYAFASIREIFFYKKDKGLNNKEHNLCNVNV